MIPLCFSVACFWCQRFGDVSPYVFILFKFGLGLVWEIAAHSVDHMFSLYFYYLLC